ncbi:MULTISPECIES: ABC transporter permease [unclassified Nocardioides]|uniref:ABC transporter permease n=1 Tax=unclassified Nocardioides TaxID=2615069 RepID=UPI000702F075|nr:MULTISPECIES: ABC transporter permease [unclassified Nocardioides]KRC46281.1 ABC transporter [Nocardioides sp. Root79]KRC69628.1 ABC transporter [Nocardioides sp. Root240]
MTDVAVPVAEKPLRSPAPASGLLSVLRQRYLLRLLVQREISARYQGSFLGLLWSYINPLTQFFIYWFVIGFLFQMHKDVPHYPIHLFAALIIVHFFTETFVAGTRSIMRNKALVVKMAMPREMFPVATMLVSLYHVGPQMVILVVVCVLSGWTPDPVGMLCLALALLIIAAIGLSGALLFSAANVFFRDFGNIVNVLTNFVRFGVPMMYPYVIVHDRFGRFADLYLLNPLADAVVLFQRAFWVGTVPDADRVRIEQHYGGPMMPDHLITHGVLALLGCLVILAFSQWVFTRLENKIPERL